MPTQYRCKNERRRQAVRSQPDNGQPMLNGIDYLEVLTDQKTLVVYLLRSLADVGVELSEDNIQILGGSRIQNLSVESVTANTNVLTVRTNQVGDYSKYTLRLVRSAFTSDDDPDPPDGFDSQLTQVSFSFWVEKLSQFDCKTSDPLPDAELPPPAIDYLAKDYASFRQLMLDRLSETMPKWKERNPSDIGVMLVELLAYTGDYLSYYQDAVATEAYLGTARKRVSIRRHARLLDYLIHDGCNARAWIVIEFNPPSENLEGITLLGPSVEKNRPGVKLLTRSIFRNGILSSEKLQDALNAGAQVFETLHDITLYSCLNTLKFYTWEDEQCSLPQGATQATLEVSNPNLQKLLKRGSVLVFEEVKGSKSGSPIDLDRSHRHVVRLTRVTATTDRLTNTSILNIRWGAEDALPFDLQISNVDDQGNPILDISVARGNVVLVDAGCTIPKAQANPLPEELWKAPGWSRLKPRPCLQEAPLTQQGYVYTQQNQWVLFDPEKPASAAMQWELRDARPAIAVWETRPPSGINEAGLRWEAQRDLLVSDRFARHFVVEIEEDGRVYLRFGDDALGKKPTTEMRLYATYRVGNGSTGNVGAGAIANLLIVPENLTDDQRFAFSAFRPTIDLDETPIVAPHNPLPAQGGVDPEPIEQIRQYAPQAFRVQRRAVTAADYADRAKQFPGVQNAIADRRWTGSWHTIFITVDRDGGQSIDEEFKQKLLAFLEEFRLAGHDIEIENPRFVALDIAMAVEVKEGYFRSAIQKALIDAFSKQILVNKQKGFFHPDRFSFGDPVYLSQVIATAIAVEGVKSVNVTRFKRWVESEEQGRRSLELGKIAFDLLEIARLDNDPSSPENGRIEFQLEGGL
ncbi:baseplate J/gp47 family protein [Leptolyngbya sp. FACHB-17]|uniref:baseplate J/gp47 family protein n=1 Tax=unclassified Leptolyngbya TaxID=2650499 RepID=UPI001681289E|nr:baseplate J/gp47 family protein [Leptolyngbya sp. FACHB-17]MBD2080945.1 baseplate J/gp47 family protein [Leptolyngbya sp. FACHB-17]